jgi:hypothetical protein
MLELLEGFVGERWNWRRFWREKDQRKKREKW